MDQSTSSGPVEPPLVAPLAGAAGLSFLVNFGVLTGREATRAEIHRLARKLLTVVTEVSIRSELHFEISEHAESEVHQVVVEVPDADALDAEAFGRVAAHLAYELEAWTRACIDDGGIATATLAGIA